MPIHTSTSRVVAACYLRRFWCWLLHNHKRARVVLLLISTLAVAVPGIHGQDKLVAPAKPIISLVVPDSYKLRIRDVQYSKDKVLIRLQNLQLQAQKAEQEAQAKDKTINEIVYQLAVENHIDLSKWVMDLDALSWQPKGK